MNMPVGRRWLSIAVASLAAAPQTGLLADAAWAKTEARAGLAAAGQTYYVDAKGGDDTADGTSPGTAWRSLDQANAAGLGPGDTLLFRRGGTWSGTLTLSATGTAAHPITVGAYGKGARPKITGTEGNCVRITGSYWEVTALRASRCQWAGFELVGDHNTLRDVHADDNIAGVMVTENSSHNVIRDSTMAGNDRMSVNDEEPDNDSGAFGVLLNGDYNVVMGNLITDSYAKSHDFGHDGAAVEIYNGDRNTVAFNVAHDNETFTELGHGPGKTVSDNRFVGNVVTSSHPKGSFLVTRGPKETHIGPVTGTIAVHNSVYLPARGTIGFSCYAGCSPKILKLRANAIKVGGVVGSADGKGVDDAGGVYWGRELDFTLGPRSVRADPRFRSRKNLRPRPGSPLIGRGVRLGASWYGTDIPLRDIAGTRLKGIAHPDAGAYQHRTSRR